MLKNTRKKLARKTTATFDAMPKPKPDDEHRRERDFGNAVEADDVRLQRSGQELRAAENEAQRQADARAERIADRDLRQRDRDVPVDVAVAQQIEELGERRWWGG